MAARIQNAAGRVGMRQVDLRDAVGLSKQLMSKYWNGESEPPAVTAIALADRLGVSVRWLVTGELDQADADSEKVLLRDFRALDDQGRHAVRTMIDAFLSRNMLDPEEITSDPGGRRLLSGLAQGTRTLHEGSLGYRIKDEKKSG